MRTLITLFVVIVFVFIVVCLASCNVSGQASCSVTDAAMSNDSSVSSGFHVTLITNPVVLIPDEQTAIMVRVDRAPGYDLPVLVELFGMPEGVDWLSREERVEDPDGIIILYLNTDEFGARNFTVPHFVVQGSDGTGLRETDHGVYDASP